MSNLKPSKEFYCNALYIVPTFEPQENSDKYKLAIECKHRIVKMTQHQYNQALVDISLVMSGAFGINIIEYNNPTIRSHEVTQRISNCNEACPQQNSTNYKKLHINIENNEYLINLTKIE